MDFFTVNHTHPIARLVVGMRDERDESAILSTSVGSFEWLVSRCCILCVAQRNTTLEDDKRDKEVVSSDSNSSRGAVVVPEDTEHKGMK